MSGFEPGPLLEEIERLVTELEKVPDVTTREKARAAVRAVLALHGAGLGRLRDLLGAQGSAGQAVLAAVAVDPLLQSLFVLHDLDPLPLPERLEAGLVRVRTYLSLNGARVELVSLQGAEARLRLWRNPATCHTSDERLRSGVEQAVGALAPDAALVIEILQEPSADLAGEPPVAAPDLSSVPASAPREPRA